ncbi:hypothetical protein ACIFQM_07990 [Paenibacillus sp. NRS-1782]|uniref:hypothetical protein n=1 Tax=unclassified Paenibacillus TaxID=185978 RepID=UPI003D2D9586
MSTQFILQTLQLETKLIEAQHVKEKATITEESLRQLLSGFQDHISSYVEKLIVIH